MKTKKRCKYCRTIVKIEDKDIIDRNEDPKSIFDDVGKGVYCKMCGAFIEVPEKELFATIPPTIHRTMTKRAQRQRRTMMFLSVVIFTSAFLILLWFTVFKYPFFVPKG